jgi:DNA-binding LacI/PurR family transcriptional regulator
MEAAKVLELIRISIVPAHFEVESAEASVDSLLARGLEFDGIVAASDLIALGAVRSLLHHGKTVPGDVSVIGFDNVPFSRYSQSGPAPSPRTR